MIKVDGKVLFVMVLILYNVMWSFFNCEMEVKKEKVIEGMLFLFEYVLFIEMVVNFGGRLEGNMVSLDWYIVDILEYLYIGG